MSVSRAIKEKLKAVGTAVAAIEKQFGKGSIMPLDGKEVADVQVIPSGSLALDLALGVMGLPRGRVIEIDPRDTSYIFAVQAAVEEEIADAAPDHVSEEAGLLQPIEDLQRLFLDPATRDVVFGAGDDARRNRLAASGRWDEATQTRRSLYRIGGGREAREDRIPPAILKDPAPVGPLADPRGEGGQGGALRGAERPQGGRIEVVEHGGGVDPAAGRDRGVGDLDAAAPQALTKGAAAQRRLLDNAPIPVDDHVLSGLLSHALSCWQTQRRTPSHRPSEAAGRTKGAGR